MNYTFLLTFIFFVFAASAKLFPIDLSQNTEVLLIDNPTDDEFVRLELLSQARTSIDIIAHTQTTGEFGLKVLRVLRDRMENNVKIRYMYEQVASMGVGEFSNRAVNLITDNSFYSKTGSELIVNRIWQKLKSPFTLSDLFHEKIIVIDRGTENEKIIIGGRNHDDSSMTSNDYTFILRKVDTKKPYLGDSLQTHFNSLFEFAKNYFQVEKPRELKDKEQYRLAEDISFLKYAPPSQIVQEILEVLSKPVDIKEGLKYFQFIPSKIRLITNDLLKHIVENRLPKTYLVRNDLLQDDITSYFSGLIDNATKIEMTSYILAPPKLIKDALLKLVAKGGTMITYLNDGKAYGRKLPFKSLGDAVHSMNFETYFELGGNLEKSPITMYTLDPNKGDLQSSPIDYNHRKVAILTIEDNHTSRTSGIPNKIVLTGSYNFTPGSASKNDEMAIMFGDSRLADYISFINRRDAMEYYIKVDPATALKVMKDNKTSLNLCRKIFQSIF